MVLYNINAKKMYSSVIHVNHKYSNFYPPGNAGKKP